MWIQSLSLTLDLIPQSVPTAPEQTTLPTSYGGPRHMCLCLAHQNGEGKKPIEDGKSPK